jgi:hypothetical protein
MVRSKRAEKRYKANEQRRSSGMPPSIRSVSHRCGGFLIAGGRKSII